MKKHYSKIAALAVSMMMATGAMAQDANTYYTGALYVDYGTEAATATMGNILCSYGKGNMNDTDPSSDQTDLAIENTKDSTSYTLVLDVGKTATYTITVNGAVKSGKATANLNLYQSVGEYEEPEAGDVDTLVSYSLVGTKAMPENSAWTTYSPITYTATLEAGINMVKIEFLILSGSYGGNVGSITIEPYIESDVPELTGVQIGTAEILSSFVEEAEGVYTCDYELGAGEVDYPEVTVTANSLGSYTIAYSDEYLETNSQAVITLSNASTGETVSTYTITFRAFGFSPFYEEPCQVSGSAEVYVQVKNILCWYEQREFPNKLSTEEVNDSVKADTNLAIGGTREGDYYTLILEVAEEMDYDICFKACVKTDQSYLTLYQTAYDISDYPVMGQNDENEAFEQLDKLAMPLSEDSWRDYQSLVFTTYLLEGINYVRFAFEDVSGSYGGNIGSISVYPSGMISGINNLSSNQEEGAEIIYNLQGVRVSNPSKGLYIQNGKKVIIK